MAPEVQGVSLVTLAAGVAAKTWKARDLVEAYLDRIARLDKKLGCFLLIDGDGARKKADAVDKKIAAKYADKFPTRPGIFKVDDKYIGGWRNADKVWFDPNNGRMTAIERAVGGPSAG